MTVQTFSASTAEAAFAKIKKTLGKGAVILDVRRVRRGVEVLAAPGSERGALRRLYEAGNSPSANQQNDVATRTAATAATTLGHDASSAGLRVVGGMTIGSPVRQTLQSIDFPPDLVARLMSIAGNSGEGWDRISTWLEQCYPSLVGSLRGKVGPAMTLGFVGPRGVGRSTLVRGLAGRAAISDPGRVAWLRVGFPRRRLPATRSAPVGVDLRTVHSLAEVGRVAEDHSDVTAMLLDLPGVDVHSPSEMSALLKFVKACDQNWGRVHWNAVIPATWSTREATRAVVAMKPLGVEAIAWTCIDQAGDSGTIVASTLRTDLPPSFVHGDRVGDGGTSNAAVWDEIIAALQKTPVEDEDENGSQAVAR
jgi:flagellar biosynthesis GTPase FlhF